MIHHFGNPKADHSRSNVPVRLYWMQLLYNSVKKQQYTHVTTLQLKICDHDDNMSDEMTKMYFYSCSHDLNNIHCRVMSTHDQISIQYNTIAAADRLVHQPSTSN
ncbi:hypothetical protein Zmor_015416 [Zophobas morio]|uniref:Uncharacterized protein n=1 Tax=Zophobas morio TaxID=2755281 RepID=A0AA38MH62_9CUCU|nr:hypothetical protein Zmor_015416 [Zophobas morio]